MKRICLLICIGLFIFPIFSQKQTKNDGYEHVYAYLQDPIFPDDYTLHGFLREDDSTQRVWIYGGISCSGYTIGEHLLYDFSLEIGDT